MGWHKHFNNCTILEIDIVISIMWLMEHHLLILAPLVTFPNKKLSQEVISLQPQIDYRIHDLHRIKVL